MQTGDLKSSRQILDVLSNLNPQDKELVTLKNQWSVIDSKIKNVIEL